MGFNFQSGHPDDIFHKEFAAKIASALAESIGPDVPLGTPGEGFCLNDEIGWSDWRALQEFAASELGQAGSQQIAAVDAWQGVYVDADLSRLVLWPDGRPNEDEEANLEAEAVESEESRIVRFLRRFGLRRAGPHRKPVEDAIYQMVQTFGPRPGEDGAVQIASLPGLITELDALLDAVGIERSEQAVEATRRRYAESDDLIEEDMHIQCLCHAWLTAQWAKSHRSPLWLVK